MRCDNEFELTPPEVTMFEQIVTVEPVFPTWGNLVQLLATSDTRRWIFRGVPSYEYHLTSKLERCLHAVRVAREGWRDGENAVISFFKQRAYRHVSKYPSDTQVLDWLSLMQHYGAPTRLTDWTSSPFVACYFAYEQAALTTDAALWILNAEWCRRIYGARFLSRRDHTGSWPTHVYEQGTGKLIETKYEGFELNVSEEETRILREAIEKEIKWPLPVPVLNPDARMTAQQACFVCNGALSEPDEPTSIELLMDKSNWPLLGQERAKITQRGYLSPPYLGQEMPAEPHHLVVKVRLPNRWRGEALTTLAKMNITGDSLFPTLDGVGRAARAYLDVGAPFGMGDILRL